MDASTYGRPSEVSQVTFSEAYFGAPEKSTLVAEPIHITTFNAGDIVPIYCREILPAEKVSLSADFVIRQTTLLTPTMGKMVACLYAFFVPNRIVNQSWKAVMGENLSGSWSAPQVTLATLASTAEFGKIESLRIPVGSVADYYGFSTQGEFPVSLLKDMHDLKFRGYLAIYNEWFRDQNYQPPIPFSTLNIYNHFFQTVSDSYTSRVSYSYNSSTKPSGSVGGGAITNAIYGNGSTPPNGASTTPMTVVPGVLNRWSALDKPLKANKIHDYFTSVLPSPQKSLANVVVPISGSIPSQRVTTTSIDGGPMSSAAPMYFRSATSDLVMGNDRIISTSKLAGDENVARAYAAIPDPSVPLTGSQFVYPSNLYVPSIDFSRYQANVDINDIRMATAIQQYYEVLARGGSRYRSIVSTFFGITVEDPFDDIPQLLGKISRELSLYQTAQTSGTGATPQGNLAGFGYTSTGGVLFQDHLFVEHGYLHVFCVVRHRNLYSSYLDKSNFRLSGLDYYYPQFNNISEQPVYTYQINPFVDDIDQVFGYQEAWAEYRYEPDQVSGYMRPGIAGSLALWNYADDFDSGLKIATGDWLKSNSETVLNRSLAVNSSEAPQFKGEFKFRVVKTLPMSVSSVPGLDII